MRALALSLARALSPPPSLLSLSSVLLSLSVAISIGLNDKCSLIVAVPTEPHDSTQADRRLEPNGQGIYYPSTVRKRG